MSASPLSGLADGQIQREQGGAIFRSGERCYGSGPVIHYVIAGKPARECLRGVASRIGEPVAYREPAKREQWGPQAAAPPRSPKQFAHPGGRPCIHSRDLIPQIERLRSEGVSWRVIGERLGIPRQAARGKVQARDKSAKRKTA